MRIGVRNILRLIAVAMAVFATTSAIAETQSPSKDVVTRPLQGTAKTSVLKKGERLLPTNGEEADAPVLGTPQLEPSSGLTLLQRLGTDLPDLPPEKPFAGKIDEAYGAFQRGLYLTAMEIALPKAQKGDAPSQTLVAELLDNGLGVRRNPKDAAFWYEQAANAGDANAQFKYAMMLMTGDQVAHDRKLANDMMHKAATGGNPEAQFNIAQILVAANPGEKGLTEALPWYEKAAAQGVPDAQYALSQLYTNLPVSDEKRAIARDWLEKAANARFDTAQYDLGIWYVNGIGGPRNFKKGFEWLRKAANLGHVGAQNKLAYLYINAIGTGPDPVEAAKWYVLSRRAGLSDLNLEDFFLGIDDEQQKEAIHRANAFRVR